MYLAATGFISAECECDQRSLICEHRVKVKRDSHHLSVRDRTEARDKDVGFDLCHLFCKKRQKTWTFTIHSYVQHHLFYGGRCNVGFGFCNITEIMRIKQIKWKISRWKETPKSIFLWCQSVHLNLKEIYCVFFVFILSFSVLHQFVCLKVS